MSIGSRTVKGILFSPPFIYLVLILLAVLQNMISVECNSRIPQANLHVALFLYMQGISVNNSYLKLYPVSPVVIMI
jgi:hypothetical protein